MIETISAIAHSDDLKAVAVLLYSEGPSYRPIGALMSITRDGKAVGQIASGCIEADIISQARALSHPKRLRYGQGSPFLDLRLPCGGMIEVLLLPKPDQEVFQKAVNAMKSRRKSALLLDKRRGTFTFSESTIHAPEKDRLVIDLLPPIRFLIFGNGVEAQIFAELIAATKADFQLITMNAPERALPPALKDKHLMIADLTIPDRGKIDEWTAITLFFHEHDLETGVLAEALETKAFYIGAQGSHTAQKARKLRLAENGVKNTDRIKGPIGLIPHARDPQTLAISVLAEITAESLKL